MLAGLEALLEGDPARLRRVLAVGVTQEERVREALTQLVRGRALTEPAWKRYTGVVWTHLDPSSLSEDQHARILIPSALYGLSRGDDPVADYRLTMGASLPGVGPLTSFWRERLTALWSSFGESVLVDLLPVEHANVVDLSVTRTTLVRVRFVSFEGDRAVGHDAKAVKGALARRVLDEGVESLEGWNWRGWRVHMAGDDVEVRAPKARLSSPA